MEWRRRWGGEEERGEETRMGREMEKTEEDIKRKGGEERSRGVEEERSSIADEKRREGEVETRRG